VNGGRRGSEVFVGNEGGERVQRVGYVTCRRSDVNALLAERRVRDFGTDEGACSCG